MKKIGQGSSQGIKPLYEATVEWLEKPEPWLLNIEANIERKCQFDIEYDKMEDTLQWAKEFMDGYERKHRKTDATRVSIRK